LDEVRRNQSNVQSEMESWCQYQELLDGALESLRPLEELYSVLDS